VTVPAHIRFISAGAGSGKTTELAKLLHEELRSERVQPGGVLATTFTTRAATELRERVQAHLISEGAYSLATAMGSARVGTVNSVCGMLLQRFAFEAGLSTEQRVLDEPSAAHLLRRSLDSVIEGRALGELIEVAQRLSLFEANRGEEPPWRAALKSLVDQARCNDIAADALRACGPMNADRLLSFFPAPSAGDPGATLASAIRSALPPLEEGARTGGKKNTANYVQLVKQTLADLEAGSMTWAAWSKLAKAEPEKGLVPVAAPIAAAAGAMTQHPRLHEDIRRYLVLMFDIAASTLDAYGQSKRQLGALDFTDQERLLLGALDHPVVRATLTDELDLLMVDEFQDTSPMQLALFLKLATHAKQVVWVGDVKQAIYGFRGSDTRLMKAVIDGLPSLGGTQDVLPHSWRSRPSLVEFVNALFGDAFDGIDRAKVILEPKRSEFAGTAAVADWCLAGKSKAESQTSLAAGIVRLVAERTQVFDTVTQTLRAIRLADIAVLARSNQSVVDIAVALRTAGIASATFQPGLLAQPESVLALACLRRLNDDRDTLSTAEVVSLADCADPEGWLSDRLGWLAAGGDPARWCEAPMDGHAVHPIIGTLYELRAEAVVLSPREAVERVMESCGLARRVIQWSKDPDRARIRLANLDRLIDLAVQYEDEALSSRSPATLSGLLLWLQDFAAQSTDALAEPAVDAVHVLTHHGAKGLEWPVVVLCDLEADIRDRVWSIQAESTHAFDMERPLRDRFVRYWPWPFGLQKTVAIANTIGQSTAGLAARADAVEEGKRLLYVSMTRARDLLVFARLDRQPVGEWMQSVGLDARLPAGEPESFVVDGGVSVPFARWALDGGVAIESEPIAVPSLAWWAEPGVRASRPPLRVSPSSLSGVRAKVLETVPLGSRIDTRDAEDRSQVGDVVHACLAAGLATPGQALTVEEVEAIILRMGIDGAIKPQALHGQVLAVQRWLQARWPNVLPQVELPVTRRRDNGQVVLGRTDLVLRTESGWILIDHKSTPQGSGQWEALANDHAGQLAGYREVLEAASGLPVEEIWLLLPVAGAALRVELAVELEPVVPPGRDAEPAAQA
jgi:ATP-dependent helicase/nuclease subunit A